MVKIPDFDAHDTGVGHQSQSNHALSVWKTVYEPSTNDFRLIGCTPQELTGHGIREFVQNEPSIFPKPNVLFFAL